MKILAIDTSTIACSIALLDNGNINKRHEIVPMQHAQCLLSFIESVIHDDIHSIDVLAWGCGPGSFTGLRIAASVVQAIGFARELPIVSVSSLAALAQTVYDERRWKKMLVAVDARMHEIYWGCYYINEEGYAELLGDEKIYAPEEVPSRALFTESIRREGEEIDWYGVGNAWNVYKKELINHLHEIPKAIDANCLPKALAIAQLGRIKYEKGEWLRPFDALPVYLRDNIVTQISKT